MFTVFFITIVLNAGINWSWIITKYNLAYTTDAGNNYYYLRSLDFNKQLLYNQFKNNAGWKEYFKDERNRIEHKTQQSFLSKSFYYKSLDLN